MAMFLWILSCLLATAAAQQGGIYLDGDVNEFSQNHIKLDPPNTKDIYPNTKEILQPPGDMSTELYSNNWYLLELRGNVSQVFNRYSDFLVYLRLNIASQTSTEFDKFSGEQFQLISVTGHDELLHPKKFQVFPSSLSDNFVLIVIIAIILLFLCIFICVCVIITINTKRRKSVYLEDDIKPGKPTNLNQLAALELQATGRFSFHENGTNVYSSTPKLRARPRGPKPPPPPRYDSLAKNATRTGRPLSVPAPCHMSLLPSPMDSPHHLAAPGLSRPTSQPVNVLPYNLYTTHAVSQDQIESDVSFVLSTLEENI